MCISYCFYCRTQPGVLGSYDKFSTEFAYPIEKGQKHDASKRELAEARKSKDSNPLEYNE